MVHIVLNKTTKRQIYNDVMFIKGIPQKRSKIIGEKSMKCKVCMQFVYLIFFTSSQDAWDMTKLDKKQIYGFLVAG